MSTGSQARSSDDSPWSGAFGEVVEKVLRNQSQCLWGPETEADDWLRGLGTEKGKQIPQGPGRDPGLGKLRDSAFGFESRWWALASGQDGHAVRLGRQQVYRVNKTR